MQTTTATAPPTGDPSSGRVPGWVRRPGWWSILLVALPIVVARWADISALGTAGRDLVQDYLAVHGVPAGQDVYERFTTTQVAAVGADPLTSSPLNVHPPFAIALFAPFAIGSFAPAAVAWSIVSVLALVTGWWLITREREVGWLVWLAPLLAWWFPVVLHLAFGQWSSLLFLALAVAWVALRRGRDATAGIAIGLAASIKLFPALLVVVLIAQRRWRALAWTIGTGALAAALAAAWSPATTGRFVSEVVGAKTPLNPFGNASVPGLVSKALTGTDVTRPIVDHPELVGPVTAIGVLAVAGVTVAVLRRTRDLDLQFCVVVLAMLLLSPVTWVHAFVMLLLPALILATRPELRRAPLLLASFVLALGLTVVDHWRLREDLVAAGRTLDRLPGWATLASPGFVVLLALFAISVVVAWRADPAEPAEEPAEEPADEPAGGTIDVSDGATGPAAVAVGAPAAAR